MLPNLDLPTPLRLTQIRMKATFLLFDLEKGNYEEAKEKSSELLKMLEEMDNEATKWREVMFQIANRIN